MKKVENLTVVIEIYNEENRLAACLKNFQWAGELIVFNKHSTDNSKNIALRHADRVIDVPYCEASENFISNIEGIKSREWIMLITASSLIHPECAKQISDLLGNKNLPYDVIGIPYSIYTFGLHYDRSPWHTSHKHNLIRRSELMLSNKLHSEFSSTSNRIFNIPPLRQEVKLIHCTHRSLDDYLDKTIRYTKYEGRFYGKTSNNKALQSAFKDILKSVYITTIRKKSFLLGWNGVALGLAYMCNYILKFLFVWEFINEENKHYKLRDDLVSQWEDVKNKE